MNMNFRLIDAYFDAFFDAFLTLFLKLFFIRKLISVKLSFIQDTIMACFAFFRYFCKRNSVFTDLEE